MKTGAWARGFSLFKQINKRFFKDACPQRAAGLAFSTVMSIVPLAAVFIGFGGPLMENPRVRDFLAQSLLPAMQDPLMDAIIKFAENGRRLGFMGIPVFLGTVLFLLNNIELTLNHVYRVETDRVILKRMAAYLVIVSSAGLFIAASISFTSDILSDFLRDLGYPEFFPLFSNKIAPFLFIFLGQFVLLYKIPGRQVKLKSALIASLTGTSLWEISKWLFAFWMGRSIRLSVIYGSVFMLPLLLIWLMLVWIILLYMAQFCYVHQNRDFFELHGNAKVSPGDDLLKSLYLISLIIRNFQEGGEALGLNALARALNLSQRATEKLLAPFLEHDILLKGTLSKGSRVYLPSKSSDKLSISRIMGILLESSNPDLDYLEDPLIRGLLFKMESSLEDCSIQSLVENNV